MAAEREDLPTPGGGTSIKDVGLIDKYVVYKRVPCNLPGCHPDHEVLERVDDLVFVLKPEGDPHARAALLRYAQVAEADGYHKLAEDIRQWLLSISADELAEVKEEGKHWFSKRLEDMRRENLRFDDPPGAAENEGLNDA